MHPKLRRALEEVDAAVFSGCSLSEPYEEMPREDLLVREADRREFLEYLQRWAREVFGYVVLEDPGYDDPRYDE